MKNKTLIILPASFLIAGLLAYLFYLTQPVFYVKEFVIKFPYVETNYRGEVGKQYPLVYDEVRLLLSTESFLNKVTNDDKLKEKSCYSCIRTSWQASSGTFITFVVRTKRMQDTQIISDLIKKEGIKNLNLYRDKYLISQIKPIFPNSNEYSLSDAEVLAESPIKNKKYLAWSHFFILIISIFAIFYFVLKKTKANNPFNGF